MDLPEFDITQIGPETIRVSKERWARYLEMMVDVGYVKGITVARSITGETIIKGRDIRITLKGLEYLLENSTMRKLYNAAKGILETATDLI